jgi:hypothetical protein
MVTALRAEEYAVLLRSGGRCGHLDPRGHDPAGRAALFSRQKNDKHNDCRKNNDSANN